MRTGDWFTTYSGKKYFLLDPHPEDVCIVDIAHALSQCCRFGGHCLEFYSVGDHVTLCKELAAKLYPDNPLIQMHLLMHDASEAYIGDIVRPLKYKMPEYLTLEAHTMDVIYNALGIPFPSDEEEGIIKHIDNTLLMTERRDIINHGGYEWTTNEEPWDRPIIPSSPKVVKLRFLHYYWELRRRIGVGVIYENQTN